MRLLGSLRQNLGAIASLAFGLPAALAAQAYSPPLPAGAGIAVPSTTIGTLGDFWTIVCIVTQWVMVFGIIIGVLFIIWGGVQYITSGGDSGKAEDAKGIILTALIGVVFLVLAVSLIKIVVSFFAGSAFTIDLSTC